MIRLRKEGAACEPGALCRECLRLRDTGDITRLSAFSEGLFFVMDEAAAAVTQALNPSKDMTVLDLCAAPGGKSFAASCMMENMGKITACDIHPRKLKLIQDMSERLGITNIETVLNDAEKTNGALCGSFDAVLLDAPCSGFGTLRKHPEIKCARKYEEVKALAAKQYTMLSAAAEYVRPGGVLVYSTCTVAREENIENIRRFTENAPFTTEKPHIFDNAETLPSGEKSFFIEENCLQLLPSAFHDAFFIARMIKNV